MQSARNLKPKAVMTVSELTGQIRAVLEETFDQVAVVGEVSNARVHTSGHWYFSLKDQEATLPCVCFKSSNSSIKFNLEDGLQVVAHGRLSVYAPRGGYQLVAATLEPVGIGDWQLAFEQLKTKLEKEGLLDSARKRPIPLLPRRVGVVTSLTGAALQDILTALSRRNKSVSVLIAPARVQGEGSVEEISRAIADIGSIPGLDVLIVGRGGGSIEDLWAFNSEPVARAVAACPVPVISGVGHEIDVTICDLVADLRAPTPTAAAELVATSSQQLIDRFDNLTRLLLVRTEKRILAARHLLQRLDPRQSLSRHVERLERLKGQWRHYRHRLSVGQAAVLERSSLRLKSKQEKLLALSPLQVLGRGYAIVRKTDGSVLSAASDAVAGEQLEVTLSRGKLSVWVTSVEQE